MLTLEQLKQDLQATTSMERIHEEDFKPLEGRNWNQKCQKAIRKLRKGIVSRVRRLVIYYFIGRKLSKGRRHKDLSKESRTIARRIYKIFSPLGRRQLANTRHLTTRGLLRLSKEEIREAALFAEDLVDDSSSDTFGVESEGVLTNELSRDEIVVPTPWYLEDVT